MVYKINGPLDLEERDENDRFHEPSVLVSPVHKKVPRLPTRSALPVSLIVGNINTNPKKNSVVRKHAKPRGLYIAECCVCSIDFVINIYL